MTGMLAWRAQSAAKVAAAVSWPSMSKARALTTHSRSRSSGCRDEAIVAAAEDGAFAFRIHEDQGLRAGPAYDGDELRLDALGGEGFAMQS